jgi:hypothetical protein
MDNNLDKRASERRDCKASIAITYFNQLYSYDAMMLNYCDDGMCFQSNLCLRPGTTICIRVKEFQPLASMNDDGEGLRCMNIAEVKWCNEISAAESDVYGVGVKYQAPSY